MGKFNREEIFSKTDGHCAYCGEKFENIKKMQVDHIVCQNNFERYLKNGFIDGSFDLNDNLNLLPSCRQCNFYKSTYSLEQFRDELTKLRERLHKNFIYKLSLKHGFINENSTERIVFYFEKIGLKTTQMTQQFNSTYLGMNF